MMKAATPLAERITDVLAESRATPEVATTVLAVLLGCVCQEGHTDLDVAVLIARRASGKLPDRN